jgi:hypothetical protein
MEKRTETQENNFGVKFQLGQKFTLHKVFGKSEGIDCSIIEISPSGKFFKVSGSDKVFSIKSLHSNGSTLVTGYYLIPNHCGTQILNFN